MSIEASLERIAVAMEALASGTRRATTEAAPAPKARAVKATQSVAEPVAEPAPAPTAVMSSSEFRAVMLKKMAKTAEVADKIKTYLRDVIKVIGLANVPAERRAEVSAKIDELVKEAGCH